MSQVVRVQGFSVVVRWRHRQRARLSMCGQADASVCYRGQERRQGSKGDGGRGPGGSTWERNGSQGQGGKGAPKGNSGHSVGLGLADAGPPPPTHMRGSGVSMCLHVFKSDIRAGKIGLLECDQPFLENCMLSRDFHVINRSFSLPKFI